MLVAALAKKKKKKKAVTTVHRALRANEPQERGATTREQQGGEPERSPAFQRPHAQSMTCLIAKTTSASASASADMLLPVSLIVGGAKSAEGLQQAAAELSPLFCHCGLNAPRSPTAAVDNRRRECR